MSFLLAIIRPKNSSFRGVTKEITMVHIGSGDFALMVDLIGAFFQGGGLPVPGAEELVPLIREGIIKFLVSHRVTIRESHPSGAAYNVRSYVGRTQGMLTIGEINSGKVRLAPHAVFTYDELRETVARHTFQQMMLWNPHALEGSKETQMHPDLRGDFYGLDFVKGSDRLVHSYSGFFNDLMDPTGLDRLLRDRGAKRTFTFGLAGDFCAGLTALHAAFLGYESYLVIDWCRNINLPPTEDHPGTVEGMMTKLKDAGVHIITSDQLFIGPRRA